MGLTPALATTRDELFDLLKEARLSGQRVALVPTMGALHVGHGSLMEVAREAVGNGPVVVSVFVNPLQFGAGEDLERYPRTLEADRSLCAQYGVDIVFAPAPGEMYPGSTQALTQPAVAIDPGAMGTTLEGATRPGHFRGVLTVVAKLFGLVRPDIAVFGQKDYQQLVMIRQMVDDLCMGIDVIGGETIREPDGLALSSRNRYLDPEQRDLAAALSRALRAAGEHASYGAGEALAAAHAELDHVAGVDIDYLVITDTDLGPAPDRGPARILVEARVGATRLLDNMPLDLGAPRLSASVTNKGDSTCCAP